MKKVIVIVIIVLAIVGVWYYYFNAEEMTPEEVLKLYVSKITNGEYEQMYEMLDEESKARVSKDVFIARNKNIYSRNRYVKYEN